MHQSSVPWIFTELFTIIFGIVLVIFHVILVALSSPIFVYRYLLCKSSHILNPNLGEMITPQGQFLATEDFTEESDRAPRAMVILSMIVKGRLDVEEVRRLINMRLLKATVTKTGNELKYPELTQYVTVWPSWFGYYFWKPEENFDLEYHVPLHQPHSPFKDSDLRNSIETWVNEPFKPRTSPWQLIVTNDFVNPNISTDEMSLLTLKAHHCLSDGFGWMYALFEDLGADVLDIPSMDRTNHTRSPWTWNQLAKQFQFPFRCVYELSKFAMLAFQIHHWKVPDERKAWKQLYWCSPVIPVQKIATIRKRFGVSFSSVIQAACASATRQCLLETSNKKEAIGPSVPSAIILPLANHPKRLVNHCTGMYVNLPLDITDPIARLKECERRMVKGINSPMPLFGRFIPVLTGSYITELSGVLGVNRQLPMGISNFVLSASKRYRVADKDLLQVTVGCGGQRGITGVNIAAYTYNGGIQFSVSAEKAIMTHGDIEKLVNRLVDEIDVLYNLSMVNH